MFESMPGVERAMRRGSIFPRPARVVVAFGTPILTAVEHRRENEGGSRAPRSLTASMTEEIRLGIEIAQATAELRAHRRSAKIPPAPDPLH
jgi:hypothetical protein